jgi:hypothetical protein
MTTHDKTKSHHPKGKDQETLDGLPPGAHAPNAIGTGGPAEGDAADTATAVSPPPEGHVEDPKASPKEQTEHALAMAQLGPLKDGHTRVKLTRNLTVNGVHRVAGDFVDLHNDDLHTARGHFEKL